MELKLTAEAWAKMRGFVDNARGEISGMGRVTRENGDFIVTDIALFEQTVSGAHSDIPAQALAQFQVELIRKGDSAEHWNLWWHSHATMGVFFSKRDTDTIDESTDFRYMLSLVTNHKHELTARIDVYEPARLYSEIDVVIDEPENAEIIEWCKTEIEKKVKGAPETVSDKKGTGYHYPEYTGGYRLYDDEEDYSVSKYHKQPALTDYNSDLWAQRLESYYTDKEELEEELKEAKQRKDKVQIQVIEYELKQLEKEAVAQGLTN
jgi:hypothetical protein